MKQTLHTSRRAIRLALLCLMAFVTWGGNYCIAQEVTLDFTQNGWKLPVGSTNASTKGEYTYNGVTISFDAPKGFYYSSKYLMLKGKGGIGRLTLPAFNFAVEKIEVVGNSGASPKTKENIYVDNTEVSKEIEGSDKTNAFLIDKQYQAAGTIYTLQVSAANAQITYIKIYKRAVDLTATTLTLSAIPTEPIAIGGTFSSTPTLKVGEQTLSDKTITWSSDNDKVATVDAATGIVTGVAAGKANITAKFAGDDTYKTSKASYEIIVKGAPSLSFPQTSYTIEMGDAFSTPKLNGLPEGVTPEFTSSNKEVATVDEATGEVKIVGVGTTTITVTSPETGIYEGATTSYELTVKLATTKKVTIDFSTFGYTDQQKVTEISQNGITMTIAKGSGKTDPQWIEQSKTLRFYDKNTLKIASKNRIKKVHFFFYTTDKSQESETNPTYDAGDFQFLDAGKTEGELDLSACNTKEVTLTFSGKVFYTKMIVTTDVSVGTISIATPEGFGTYYNSNSYILPEGLTAFGYTKANTDGTLVKTDVFNGGDVVPANAALVVKGNTGEYECYATDQVAMKTLEGNLLKGVAKATTVEKKEGFKRYVLTTVNGVLGFYRTQSGNIKVPANRAYLELTEAQAQAVSFFQLDGETTGIENATATTKEAPKAIYTLSGVRLKATTTQGLPAGAYVVNGKVVIVK
uniref:Ig-like domain-containing protein n=1 Tax=Alloprevotella sp. TaxID=1872471 RepID=UPI003FEE88B2